MAFEVGRYSWEVVAKAPPITRTVRVIGETAFAEDAGGAGDVEIHRFAQETLAELIPAAKTVRLVGETVFAEDAPDGTALVEIHGYRWETVSSEVPEMTTTRLVGEIAFREEQPTSGTMEVERYSWETLGATSLGATVCENPPELDFFIHNWVDSLRLETEFLTSICRSPESVSEDRWSKRDRPVRSIKVKLTEQGDDSGNIQNARLHRLLCVLESSTEEHFKMPLFSDASCIVQDQPLQTGGLPNNNIFADTRLARFYVGGGLVIVKLNPDRTVADWQFTSIDSRAGANELVLADDLKFDTTRADTIIMPVICCEPELKFRISQNNCRVWQMELNMVEDYGPTALPPLQDDLPPNFDTYRGNPILRLRHDYSSPLPVELVREGEKTRLGRGTAINQRGDEPRRTYKPKFIEERERAWDYIRFFESRRGRARSYWVIDQTQTLEILQVDDTFIDINPVGDFLKFRDQVQGNFFGFELKDGTDYVRQIVTVQEVLGVWRLTTVEPLGITLADNDTIALAGRAFPARFREDKLVENWETLGACRFELDIITLLDENPYDLEP